MKKKKSKGKKAPLASTTEWPIWDRKSSTSLALDRYIGISLGGGKSDRTTITVLEYYLQQKKLVVSRVIDRLKSEGDFSSDLKIHEFVHQFKSEIQWIAMDVPLSLPKCFRCTLPCPGYEICEEPEIRWMWKHHRQESPDDPESKPRRKTQRLFTPYTRRCAEVYWSQELPANWNLGDGLGANQAPLLARGHFLRRRWNYPTTEVIPRLSLWRWAQKETLPRSHLLHHRHAVGGAEARHVLLQQMIAKMNIFIYEQDQSLFVDHLVAFDSLWAALTAFWKGQKRCEPRPRHFPREEGWIDVPFF